MGTSGCKRCGLMRPQWHGTLLRCGCCGLMYDVNGGGEPLEVRGTPNAFAAGSTPAAPAIPSPTPLK